jgi:hypothetical protein
MGGMSANTAVFLINPLPDPSFQGRAVWQIKLA